MKNLYNIISLITLIVLFASCENIEIDSLNDGLIDDAERAIMDECSSNHLTSKSDIENSLIGEWELIGHGNSTAIDEIEPNIYLTISSENLIIEYQSAIENWTDTVTWEIEETNTPAGQFFRLETTPYHFEILISNFCENYMYLEVASVRVESTKMYLYEKVR